MIIHVKRACEFTSDSGEKFSCPKDFIGIPPDWIKDNDYFKALCSDGKITFHIDSGEAERNAADEKITEDKKKKK
jgi:hypothetical protein